MLKLFVFITKIKFKNVFDDDCLFSQKYFLVTYTKYV